MTSPLPTFTALPYNDRKQHAELFHQQFTDFVKFHLPHTHSDVPTKENSAPEEHENFIRMIASKLHSQEDIEDTIKCVVLNYHPDIKNPSHWRNHAAEVQIWMRNEAPGDKFAQDVTKRIEHAMSVFSTIMEEPEYCGLKDMLYVLGTEGKGELRKPLLSLATKCFFKEEIDDILRSVLASWHKDIKDVSRWLQNGIHQQLSHRARQKQRKNKNKNTDASHCVLEYTQRNNCRGHSRADQSDNWSSEKGKNKVSQTSTSVSQSHGFSVESFINMVQRDPSIIEHLEKSLQQHLSDDHVHVMRYRDVTM